MQLQPANRDNPKTEVDAAAPTAVDDAVALIRQALVDGRFRPGERLKAAQVSNELGISTMPVREALRQLEGEGIIQILPNRGAVVRPVDGPFLENLYEVRTALEEIALRRAISRMTFDRLNALERLAADYSRAAERDDLSKSLDLGRALHLEIFNIAGNAHATRIFQRDWELVQALRLKFGYQAGRMKVIAQEQSMLVDALRRADLETATAIIRMHNNAGLEDLLSRLSGDVRRP